MEDGFQVFQFIKIIYALYSKSSEAVQKLCVKNTLVYESLLADNPQYHWAVNHCDGIKSVC